MASEKITAIIDEVKALSVLELADLVSALEEEFGVSAAAPVVVAGDAGAAGAAEEKTEFDVVLVEAGASKIQVLVLLKQRLLLTALRKLSKRLCRRMTLKLLKLSSKKQAQRLNSSNLSILKTA